MLFRYTARPVGPRLATLFRAPVLTQPFQSRTFSLTSRRFSQEDEQPQEQPQAQQHQIPHLQPPWQVADLKKWEREAFAKFGSDYLKEVSTQERSSALHGSTKRMRLAKRLERELGPNWYELLKESQALQQESEAPVFADVRRRVGELKARFEEVNKQIAAVDDKTSVEMKALLEKRDEVKEDFRKVKKEKLVSREMAFAQVKKTHGIK